MREIKFRFWGPFGDWEEPGEMEQKKTMLYGDEFAWEDYEPINDLFSDLPNNDTIAMQFTGLHDKNGKGIYEGDILNLGVIGPVAEDRLSPVYHVVKVLFDEGGACFIAYPEWYLGGTMHGELCALYTEVIGNIYENPELLEKK